MIGNQYVFLFSSLGNHLTSSPIYLDTPRVVLTPCLEPLLLFLKTTQDRNRNPQTHTSLPLSDSDTLAPVLLLGCFLWGLCLSVSLPSLLRWSCHYHTLNASHHTLYISSGIPSICLMGQQGAAGQSSLVQTAFVCVCLCISVWSCVFCNHCLHQTVHLKSSVCVINLYPTPVYLFVRSHLILPLPMPLCICCMHCRCVCICLVFVCECQWTL